MEQIFTFQTVNPPLNQGENIALQTTFLSAYVAAWLTVSSPS